MNSNNGITQKLVQDSNLGLVKYEDTDFGYLIYDLPDLLDATILQYIDGRTVTPYIEYCFKDIANNLSRLVIKSSAISLARTSPLTLAMFNMTSGSFGGGSGLTPAQVILLNNAIQTSQKGVANGVAPLNSSNKIDSTYLPANDFFKSQGSFDASTGTAPIATPTQADDGKYWKISVAGTIATVAYAVGDLIVCDGVGFFKIPAGSGPVLASKIQDFSNTVSYAIGDQVIQNNRIYKANVAITAGAFNPTQWTELSDTFILSATTTNTGTLTAPQETALTNNTIHKNTTTGEVWIKSNNVATKIVEITKKGLNPVGQITGGATTGSAGVVSNSQDTTLIANGATPVASPALEGVMLEVIGGVGFVFALAVNTGDFVFCDNTNGTWAWELIDNTETGVQVVNTKLSRVSGNVSAGLDFLTTDVEIVEVPATKTAVVSDVKWTQNSGIVGLAGNTFLVQAYTLGAYNPTTGITALPTLIGTLATVSITPTTRVLTTTLGLLATRTLTNRFQIVLSTTNNEATLGDHFSITTIIQ